MKTIRAYKFGSLAVLLGILASGAFESNAAFAQDAQRIAVVNIRRVFNNYKKVAVKEKELKDHYKDKFETLKTEENGLKAEETDLKAEMKGSAPSEELLKKEMDLKLKVFSLQKRKYELQNEFNEAHKKTMEEILKDIRGAIREVAKSEKYDVVMRAPEFEEAQANDVNQPRNAAELVMRFRENPVLYVDTSVDITEKVIAKLDSQ